MTMHRAHPANSPATLHDDCPRCKEHANTLHDLEAHNLRRIWRAPVSYLDHIARANLLLYARLADQARNYVSPENPAQVAEGHFKVVKP